MMPQIQLLCLQSSSKHLLETESKFWTDEIYEFKEVVCYFKVDAKSVTH